MQGTTAASPRLTERDLIAKMESYGIGTDATVADHIQKQVGVWGGGEGGVWGVESGDRMSQQGGNVALHFTHPRPWPRPCPCAAPPPPPVQLERGYASKDDASMTFGPTPLGESLISAYRRMGLSNLWRPELRGVIERNIAAVAAGQRTKDSVLAEAVAAFKADFEAAQAQVCRWRWRCGWVSGSAGRGDARGRGWRQRWGAASLHE